MLQLATALTVFPRLATQADPEIRVEVQDELRRSKGAFGTPELQAQAAPSAGIAPCASEAGSGAGTGTGSGGAGTGTGSDGAGTGTGSGGNGASESSTIAVPLQALKLAPPTKT